MRNSILVRGARENNLKNVDVEIPRDALCVFTGLSGSGKSSLAFDTIYAEGRRRYVDSLSAYARQFLGQMDKPDVDVIEGLSPAISIDQKTTSRNPRSTVGTVTEIYDYLRLLWARAGTPHCPRCGREIRRQTVDQIVDKVLALPEGTRFQVLAPVVRGKKGEHVKLLADARKSVFSRVRVDGILYDLSEEITLEKNKKHTIELVVDRLVLRGDLTRRLTDSVETALEHGGGLVVIQQPDTGEETLFSRNYACDECGISMPELSPRMFSFNNPMGACPECSGLGFLLHLRRRHPGQRLGQYPQRLHRADVLRRPVAEISLRPARADLQPLEGGHGRHPLRHARRKAHAALRPRQQPRNAGAGV